MKKFLMTLCFFLYSFFIFAANESPKEKAIAVNQMCGSDHTVAVDSIFYTWDGQAFRYRIKWCTTSFITEKRFINFKVTATDENGEEIRTAQGGPVLESYSQLLGIREAGFTATKKPSRITIKWGFVDYTGETPVTVGRGEVEYVGGKRLDL